MRTTITIDDDLFKDAAKVLGDGNISSLITKALKQIIASDRKKRILRLSGAIPDFAIPGRDSRSDYRYDNLEAGETPIVAEDPKL